MLIPKSFHFPSPKDRSWLKLTQPAGGGGISRVSLLAHLLLALSLGRRILGKHLDSLFGGNSVGDITEVDAADKLLGGHVDNEFPERLALGLGPKIPDRVNDGTGREMNSALLGANPAQLAVACADTVGSAHISSEVAQLLANELDGERLDGRAADLGTTTAGKGHTVTLDARVCVKDDISGRVVRVLVHGVRAVQVERGREADVTDFVLGDSAILHGGWY